MSTEKEQDSKNRPSRNDPAGKQDDGPSEFVTGLVTFIVFLIFMTVWMYYGLDSDMVR